MRRTVMRVVRRSLVLLGVAANGLIAQSPGMGDGRPYRAIVVTGGVAGMSVDPLNAFLSAAGFAAASPRGPAVGASGYIAFGRALLGADLAWARIGAGNGGNARRTLAVHATQLTTTIAYAVVATPRLTLYPQLGVGIGRVSVALGDNNGGAASSQAQPTFAEIAQAPGNGTTITGHHLLFTAGLGQDYLLMRQSPREPAVVIGVRAGIALAPNRTTWNAGSRAVIAGPDASLGGPFLKVVLGIGTR